MIAGIDEAGRGCIIGPMVLAAAFCQKEDEAKLRKIGVRDSKKLTPAKREELAPLIKKICRIGMVKVSAHELTSLMSGASLNEIEALKIGELLNSSSLKPSIVYVDSPDNIPKNFELRIRKYLKSKLHIISQNKAEDRFPCVAAASIVAKVERDNLIESIKQETGFDFGSGYTSDPLTIKFLETHANDPKIKQYLRWKWKTLENIKQKTLADY
ncbi:ribonuclease HII [Candidatus Parvarchaeota archaeon]|nr:ribonuclease HII [Candidatus Parvarchaeota archaeon]